MLRAQAAAFRPSWAAARPPEQEAHVLPTPWADAEDSATTGPPPQPDRPPTIAERLEQDQIMLRLGWMPADAVMRALPRIRVRGRARGSDAARTDAVPAGPRRGGRARAPPALPEAAWLRGPDAGGTH